VGSRGEGKKKKVLLVFVSQRSRNFQEGFSKGCSASDLTVMNKKGGGKPRSANVGVTRGKRGLKRELYKKGKNARAKLAPYLKMRQSAAPNNGDGAVTIIHYRRLSLSLISMYCSPNVFGN
jgi:hypothetical protein